MDRLRRLKIIAITALTLLGAAPQAMYGATDKEMDRARAIAAQVYLRYTNDKADYLDGFKPQSVADVRAKVSGHAEDEANLQKFLSAPVSNDYPNWGKEEMVRYWSSDFFSGSGLSDKAADTRNRRIQARLNTMDVTAPSPQSAEEPQQEQPTENMNPNMVDITTPTEVPTTAAVDTTKVEETETITETDKGSSNLWIYIVLLIVLIGVVIALVVYALKSMRNQNGNGGGNGRQRVENEEYERPAYRQEAAPARPAPRTYDTESEGRYSRAMAAKDTEIESLRREVEDSRVRSEQLASRLGALQLEVQRLSEENAALKGPQMPQPVIPAQAPGAPRGYNLEHETVTPMTAPSAPRQQRFAPEEHLVQPRTAPAAPAPSAAPRGNERVVYLGRVNRDNVFVRADKQLVSGKTIYRLVTTNGVTGSFYVEPDPVIMGWVSLDPETALADGCSIVNPGRIHNFSRISTEAAGTAIFEDGCWKVLRPATVRLD